MNNKWNEPTVAAARALKQKVSVDGTEYRSFKSALEALGMETKGHEKLRKTLKETGSLEFGGKIFHICE